MDLTLVWSRIRVRVTCRVKVRASISIRPTKIISMVPVTYPEKIRVGRSDLFYFILFYFNTDTSESHARPFRWAGKL